MTKQPNQLHTCNTIISLMMMFNAIYLILVNMRNFLSITTKTKVLIMSCVIG